MVMLGTTDFGSAHEWLIVEPHTVVELLPLHRNGRSRCETGTDDMERNEGYCPCERLTIWILLHRSHKAAEVSMNPPRAVTQKMPPL